MLDQVLDQFRERGYHPFLMEAFPTMNLEEYFFPFSSPRGMEILLIRHVKKVPFRKRWKKGAGLEVCVLFQPKQAIGWEALASLLEGDRLPPFTGCGMNRDGLVNLSFTIDTRKGRSEEVEAFLDLLDEPKGFMTQLLGKEKEVLQ